MSRRRLAVPFDRCPAADILPLESFQPAAGAPGSVTPKQLPFPGALRTAIRPRWVSTTARQMARPRPTPERSSFWDESTRKNRSKTRPWSSSGIPIPSSSTSTTSSCPACRPRTQIVPPGGVYFVALSSRLKNSWLSRMSSPTRIQGGERLNHERVPPVGGPAAELFDDVRHQEVHPHAVFQRRELPGVVTAQGQELMDQFGQARGFVGGLLHRAAVDLCVPRGSQDDFRLRPQRGDRRPQLVGRIGREAPHLIDRAVQPVEHRVEGQAEPSQFVARVPDRQPLIEPFRGDPFRRGDHLFDWRQRVARQAVAGRDGDEESDRNRGDDGPEVPLKVLAHLGLCGGDLQQERTVLAVPRRQAEEPELPEAGEIDVLELGRRGLVEVTGPGEGRVAEEAALDDGCIRSGDTEVDVRVDGVPRVEGLLELLAIAGEFDVLAELVDFLGEPRVLFALQVSVDEVQHHAAEHSEEAGQDGGVREGQPPADAPARHGGSPRR